MSTILLSPGAILMGLPTKPKKKRKKNNYMNSIKSSRPPDTCTGNSGVEIKELYLELTLSNGKEYSVSTKEADEKYAEIKKAIEKIINH